MSSASEESDGYEDMLFDLTLSNMTKCSLCNKEVKCVKCEVEHCKFVVCKTCSKQSNYGVLESHAYGHCNKETYAKLLDVLAHVSTCADQLCTIISCRRARELMTHLSDCNKRLQGQCSKCKKIWVGVCAHASHCTNLDCHISHCRHVKEFKSLKG